MAIVEKATPSQQVATLPHTPFQAKSKPNLCREDFKGEQKCASKGGRDY
jgi:hypothetical protein